MTARVRSSNNRDRLYVEFHNAFVNFYHNRGMSPPTCDCAVVDQAFFEYARNVAYNDNKQEE